MVAEEIGERVRLGSVELLGKPSAASPTTEEEAADRRPGRLMVAGLGDCGACTACSVHDALLWMETAGAPSTVLVTEVFVFTVARFSKVLGGPGYHHLALPHPVATKSAGRRRRPGSGGGARGGASRMTPDERPARAPRSDGVRNRAWVAEAAYEGFADRGLDAKVAQVADRAGVGNATVFRHFPTKADLLDGVATHWLKDWADGLQRRIEATPRDALADLVPARFERLRTDRFTLDVLRAGTLHPEVERPGARPRSDSDSSSSVICASGSAWSRSLAGSPRRVDRLTTTPRRQTD